MSRFVRTEAGRVLKLVDDPSVRMLELVDGEWVKPGEPPIQFSDLWGAERLSEDEVTKLVKSAKKVAKTPRYVRTEDGRVFEIADTSPMLRELVSGEWVKPAGPVFGGELMDATPLSETDVEKMIKTPRYILTESGRVFDDSRPYPDWLLELVDGEWVKPVSKVLVTELMDGRELSEVEVANLVKSTEKVAKTPRFVRTEDGRVFRLPATDLAELSNGVWVKPVSPIFGGELMRAEPLSEEEVAQLMPSSQLGVTPEQAKMLAQRTREIEEAADAETEEMLDRLIAKRMKRSQATTPTTTTPSVKIPAQDTRKNEEVPTKGKIKTWLKSQNSVLLRAFSKYFPVGCLVCVGPDNVFSFAGNTLDFITTGLFYAFIAFVFTEAVDHMLGENATNLRRIKAIAAEVVFAAAMFWWLID